VTNPIPDVQVAGLLVPAPLAARIITAIRGTYEDLTTGLADDAAIQAVLKYWVTNVLASYEASQALAPGPAAAQKVIDQYASAGEDARQQAIADAEAIVPVA